MQLFTAKSLAIFFGLATIAFTVSTIVLAVQKAELQDELDDALDKLNGADTTTASTGTTATTTTSPTIPTNPGDTTQPTNPGDTTTPSVSDPSTPSTPSTASTPSTPSTPSQPTPPTIDPPTTTTTEFPWPTVTEETTTRNPDFPVPNEIIYRLPNHARPYKYQLYLNPDLKEGTYEGTVTIGVDLDKPTDVLALHSKDLEIFGVSVLQVMARMRIRIKDYYTDPVRQLLIIEFGEVLQLYVPYTVSISFRGSLKGLSGFYSSSYTDAQGDQK